MSEELAALGPYFALEFHGTSAHAEAGAPWQPMTGLADPSCEAMAERVAGVRAYLAAGTGQDDASAVELRVAASVVHLGLVARVVSPLVALAVLRRRSGHVRAVDLCWQPTLGSLFPLSVRQTVFDAGESVAEDELDLGFGSAGSAGSAGGVVGEFGAAVARFGVNEHIVRGNVASALAGAGKMLTAARPDLRDDVRALINRLLGGSHLAGSGGFEPDGTFRRRSCCLIYRAAPDRDGGLCGDCVLAAAHGPMDT